MAGFKKWGGLFSYKAPADYDKELLSRHHQCPTCGRITKGPGKEPEYPEASKYPPYAYHIDEEGVAYQYRDALKKGHEDYNVSNGFCRHCLENFTNEQRRGDDKRMTMREWRALQDKYLETQQRVKDEYEGTQERVKSSFEDTIAQNKANYEETMGLTDSEPDSQEVPTEE